MQDSIFSSPRRSWEIFFFFFFFFARLLCAEMRVMVSTSMQVHSTIFASSSFQPRVHSCQYSDSGKVETILLGAPWKSQNIGNSPFLSFLSPGKAVSWEFPPSGVAPCRETVVRSLKFSNQLQGGWFCILLECRSLSTGVWISRIENWSVYC